MAELALDQRQPGSFVRQRDGVRVAQLMWAPPADAIRGLAREMVRLGPRLAG